MSHKNASILSVAAMVAVALLPTFGNAQGQPGHRTASASLRIQIVVQPYARVLSDVHPQQINAQVGSPVSAEQHVSVVTNEQHGFCLDLMPAIASDTLRWQLQSVIGVGVSYTPFGDGYRVCSAQNGTYAFTLVHRFVSAQAGNPLQTPWPIVAVLAQM